MWEQYRRTFWRTQITILLIVAFVYFSTGGLMAPTAFMFVMMQGFSLIGVAWATRLKRMLERNNESRLPLEPRG
jgi:hypothetical protein